MHKQINKDAKPKQVEPCETPKQVREARRLNNPAQREPKQANAVRA